MEALDRIKLKLVLLNNKWMNDYFPDPKVWIMIKSSVPKLDLFVKKYSD